ncbi:MAG TPA: hypothetical protein VMI56_04750 [Reyranella sp.]|nr:hypothetical protein [Reyranella sp.]
MLRILGLSALASGALVIAAGQAEANGCNGHVNVAEWGCAPWDNNNGPQFPHYVAPKKPVQPPQAHTTPVGPKPLPVQPPAVHSGNGNGILGNSGANMGNNGGGIISSNSGSVVGPAGGSLVDNNGGHGVVAAGGGNKPGQGSNGLVGNAGGTLISPGNRNGN